MRIVLQFVGDGSPEAARQFDNEVVRVGRDPANEFILPGTEATGVSRHHAEIRYVGGAWRIVDLQSTNGTYLNGRRVSNEILRSGDEIQFTARGPRVRVSFPDASATIGAPGRTAVVGSEREPHDSARPPGPEPTPSELFPMQMGVGRLAAKGYLIHALITIVAVSSLIWGFQSGYGIESLYLLHIYLTAASLYVVYLLCGKTKPLWLFATVAIGEGLIVTFGFRYVKLPAAALVGAMLGPEYERYALTMARPSSLSIPGAFISQFFGVALAEELVKVLPVLLGLYLLHRQRQTKRTSPLQDELKVTEPLDGILLGAAGAAGFTILEGIDYMRGAANATAVFRQLLLRSIGGTFGHGAYSGIFGYYLGLAAVRPGQTPQLFLRGILFASALHALWNTMTSSSYAAAFSIIVPLVSFLLLIACILQARKVSPTRATNFATWLGRAV